MGTLSNTSLDGLDARTTSLDSARRQRGHTTTTGSISRFGGLLPKQLLHFKHNNLVTSTSRTLLHPEDGRVPVFDTFRVTHLCLLYHTQPRRAAAYRSNDYIYIFHPTPCYQHTPTSMMLGCTTAPSPHPQPQHHAPIRASQPHHQPTHNVSLIPLHHQSRMFGFRNLSACSTTCSHSHHPGLPHHCFSQSSDNSTCLRCSHTWHTNTLYSKPTCNHCNTDFTRTADVFPYVWVHLPFLIFILCLLRLGYFSCQLAASLTYVLQSLPCAARTAGACASQSISSPLRELSADALALGLRGRALAK